jgi:hypothetical protein
MRYYCDASQARRVGPGELPGPLAVLRSRGDATPVGFAVEVGGIGGPGAAEVVWCLAVDGAVVGRRYALRAGRFVELAEDAE